MSEEEKSIAFAIEKLREDMPQSFIIVYERDDSIQTIVYATFTGVQRLLHCALETISEGYAANMAMRADGDRKDTQ